MGDVEEGNEVSMAWRMDVNGLEGVPSGEVEVEVVDGESEPVFSST